MSHTAFLTLSPSLSLNPSLVLARELGSSLFQSESVGKRSGESNTG